MKEKEKKPMDVSNFKALTIKQASAIFKVEPLTLWRWCANSGCPRHEFWKGRSRRWQYYREEILAWLEENKPDMRQAQIEAGYAVTSAQKKKYRDKYFVNYPPIGSVLPNVPKEEGDE